MIKIGIAGASGYTGLELIRLLVGHPGVEACLANHLYCRLYASAPPIRVHRRQKRFQKEVEIKSLAAPLRHGQQTGTPGEE